MQFAYWFAGARLRHARNRDIRELMALDDHVLKDIGLTRGDMVRSVVETYDRRAQAMRAVSGRRWKWRLSALAVVVLLPLAAMAAEPPRPERPVHTVERLEINTVNRARLVVHASRSDGFLQAIEVSRTGRFEEQWAFVPSAGLWFEIGSNEVASDRESEVEIDVEFVRRLLEVYPAVELVHVHPGWYFGELHDPGRPAAAMTEPASLALALPSGDDVATSLALAGRFGDRVTFAVVSPYGKVSYGPTVQGLRRIADDRGNPMIQRERDIMVSVAIRRYPVNVNRVAASASSAAAAIVAMCDQASGPDYTLSYLPAADGGWR